MTYLEKLLQNPESLEAVAHVVAKHLCVDYRTNRIDNEMHCDECVMNGRDCDGSEGFRLLISEYIPGFYDDNIPDPPWMSCEKDCRHCKEEKCSYRKADYDEAVEPLYDPDDYLKREVPSGNDAD